MMLTNEKPAGTFTTMAEDGATGSSKGGETLTFDRVYLQGRVPRGPGKFKLAQGGLGWKDLGTGQVLTIPATDFASLQWERGWKDQQLRILRIQDGAMLAFDGFTGEVLSTIRDFCRREYGMTIEERDGSLRGANWGAVSIDGKELEFRDEEAKLIWNLPLTEVINCTSAARDEVALEFAQPETQDKHTDTLVEVRLYVPPHSKGRQRVKAKEHVTTADGEKEEEDADKGPTSEEEEEEAEQEMEPAKALAEKIKGLSQMQQMMGDIIASIPDVPCIVPRGRFHLEMGRSHLRLHGKSYDHRVLYSSIIKALLLPKNDDLHVLFVLALDPPLRQGQTRYPFVLFQFDRDEELELDLQNIDIKQDYDGKLQAHYEAPTFEVISTLFRILAGQKIIVPGSFRSQGGEHSVKCVFKANEGQLYPLERNFLFLPKPITLLPHADIAHVEFSRTGSGLGNPRTFDLRFFMKNTASGMGSNSQEIALNNVPKEEQMVLEEFIQSKGISISAKDEERFRKHAAYQYSSSEEEDEEERQGAKTAKRRRPKEEDEEEGEDASSPDEDYKEGESEDESDVDEEYDEDYESNDEEESGGEEDDGGDENEE